jgi:quinoprotein glucose dehydrogenase
MASTTRRALVAMAWLVAACAEEPVPIRPGPTADWTAYGGDPGGQRFSPLDQIDRGNVARLRVAWTFRTGELDAVPPPPKHATFQATPLVVDGTLYVATPLGRVFALDPETGAERWRFDARVENRRVGEFTTRGLATYLDPERAAGEPCRRRLYLATIESELLALDAATGRLCADFGEAGAVDLRREIGRTEPWEYGVSSPPAIVGSVLVVGSAIADNARTDMARGIVRGYDARSGALLWAWDPIEGVKNSGAANAWSILSADPSLGLVFVPTSSPSPDYYGGERPGDNRHANSVVALRAATGEVVWAFQTVHHDLFDYDVPAQPTLAVLVRDGREIPVVVQTTKTGNLFVLHRETGEPFHAVEERTVPASDVPGDAAWPTQPFPTRPPPLVPQRLAPEDAWGFTPWDRGRCRDAIAALRNEGIFTPPSLEGSIVFPGIGGGSNWGGVAVDPRRGVAFANTTRLAFFARLVPRERYVDEDEDRLERAPQLGAPFGMERGPLLSPLGLPCNPPPWGALSAIDLVRGEILWEAPLGTVPDDFPVALPIRLGLPNLGGPLATAGGLVFVAAAMDDYLRAFDAESGEEIWRGDLPAGGQATPMTYRVREDGRQYVAIAAGGHGKLGTRRGDYVVAFALP